ncbi:MAG: sugar phosphate isomerase/epimerase family protein [Beijerinckiaceae bacterium]
MKPADRLSFQLYSARTLEPLEKQLQLLSTIGYRMVEPFGGLFGDVGGLKDLLEKYRFTAPTAHVGLDRLRADPKATVQLCRSLGIATIFAPAPPMGEREGDEAHWRNLGRELKAIGKIVTGEGLKFGWHNHHWEFGRTATGQTFLDCMFEEAPDLLWQADLAWIVRGNADPVVALQKYATRVVAAHIKDIAPAGEKTDEDGWADPGHGVLDWTKLRSAMRATNINLFVVEHDKPNDVARFARNAYATVTSWS